MNEPQLHFTSAKIRRLLGFHDDGFDVPRLSPGVNIIYGPNAAGKTTFGLALRHLLWRDPDDLRHISIAGTVNVQGALLAIEIDHGRVSCQQEGRDVDPPLTTSLDSANRYVLALHDLLQDEQEGAHGFAEQILRESAGGYDIAAAADKLEFAPSPRARKSKRFQDAVNEARQQVHEIRQRQRELESQAAQLGELRRQKQDAIAAQQRLAVISKAEDYLEASEKLREATLAVDAFPKQLQSIGGQEIERLNELRQRRASLEEEKQQLQVRLSEARRAIEAADLAPESLSVEQIGGWRNTLRRLDELQAREEAASLKATEQRTVEDEAARFFGEPGISEELQAIDAGVVAEMSGYARRWTTWQVNRQKNAEAIRLLTVDEADASPEDLREACSLLDQWLTLIEPSPSVLRAGRFTTWVLAALALGLVGVLLWHQHWIIGATLAVVLPLAQRLLARYLEQISIDERERLERQVSAIGVPQPNTWTPESVRKHRHELQHTFNAATINQQRAARRRELEDEQRQLTREGHELEEQWNALSSRTVRPPIAEDDPTFLAVWASNLCEWQRAHRTRLAAEHELQESQSAMASLLQELRNGLAAVGCDEGLSSEKLGPTIETLAARQQQVATATPVVENCTEQIAAIDDKLGNQQQAEEEVFKKVGLTPDDEPQLRQWVETRSDYLKCKQNLDFARGHHDAAAEALADLDDWKEKSREALLAERGAAEQIAEGATEIDQQIGAIEKQVELAKKQHDLETALAELDEQKSQLRARREEDKAAMVGNLLANYLKEQQRERDRPPVFRKAQDAFVRITHGRYQLDVDQGDPPRLRAIDTATGRGQPLDELSSGTRLQLLLAVRVAFIEQQELGPKLPLIFDETLGNSDERRASEIIDAAIELCRDGRQLFYLTAQWDEVAKWRAVLEDKYPDVPLELVDLAERRGFSEQERIPPVELPRMPEPISIPSPAGHDLWAYRGLLGVPGFDPFRPLGGTHLWYFIEDTQALYALLKLGINNWGQLEALAARGGFQLEGMDDQIFAKATASQRVLEALCTAWQIGRGRPADRAVLQESGLKPRWIEEVANLSKRLQGDAKALVEALRNKQVKRMPATAIEGLEEYFREHQYLSEVIPLNAEQIRTRVVSAVSQELNKGTIDAERIDWLLRVTSPEHVEGADSGTEFAPESKQQQDFTAKMAP